MNMSRFFLRLIVGVFALGATTLPTVVWANTPKSAEKPANTCQITPASAYVLGDSLAYGLKHAGLEVTLRALLRGPQTISFDGGRSITTPGMHIKKSALESVDADAALVSAAKVIIVVLGTNIMEPNFGESQAVLMRKLRGLNPKAHYFWVDIGATMSNFTVQWSERNKTIYDNAQPLGYQVISRYKAIFGPGADPLRIQPGLLFPGYASEPGYGGQGSVHGYDLELSQAILDALLRHLPPAPCASK